MTGDFWRRMKFMITGGGPSLPPKAVAVIDQFKKLIVHVSNIQHVDWFGKSIVRCLDEDRGVKYSCGLLTIDVGCISTVPGGWGDEIFSVMYSVEEALRLCSIQRKMYLVPDDFDLPLNLQSN